MCNKSLKEWQSVWHKKRYKKIRKSRIIQVMEWQKNNREKTRAYSKKWYAKNKEYMHQWYLDRKTEK